VAPVNAVARAERAALADLFLQVGPDAPTLCGGWRTRDLAAHIVVRERRPDAAGGIVLPFLASYGEKVQDGIAAGPWEQLVATMRQGPPAWNPMGFGPFDAQANTVEFFVHHEDVRRCQEGWAPRDLDAATVEALWKVVPTTGRFICRRSPVGITASPTDGPAAGTSVQIKGGVPDVTLVGPTGEILLALYGRITEGLEIHGDPSAAEAFRSFPR
jgi:uncharacterized protein (TIGR03085 family)